jgi:phosphatidylserine/phosphatidylglycerophosphate/cardiolipin synthase-like enzyme
MRVRALVVLLLFSLLCNGLAWAKVEVYFSPHGGCDQAIIQLARSARMYLDAACYTFSLDSIADELIAAKNRGVNVRIILDRSQSGQTWCPASRLAAAGIPVRINTHSGLMHDKFLVADGRSVATGSFNWTAAAVQKNDENLVVFLGETAVASAFAVQFDQMWHDTSRFTAFSARPTTTQAPAPPPSTVQPPPSPQASADTVYITKTGTKYHRAGCRYLARSSIPISRKDAEARGYAPCKVCSL